MNAVLAAPTPRLDDVMDLAPRSVEAMQQLGRSCTASGLDFKLLELVKLRASQINGCLFCIDMHVELLLSHGENPLRLHHLSAWRESPLFSTRERAALAWCEALTRLSDTGAPDADYEALQSQFTPAHQVALTFAIGAINVWNRVNVGFRKPPIEKSAAA